MTDPKHQKICKVCDGSGKVRVSAIGSGGSGSIRRKKVEQKLQGVVIDCPECVNPNCKITVGAKKKNYRGHMGKRNGQGKRS